MELITAYILLVDDMLTTWTGELFGRILKITLQKLHICLNANELVPAVDLEVADTLHTDLPLYREFFLIALVAESMSTSVIDINPESCTR